MARTQLILLFAVAVSMSVRGRYTGPRLVEVHSGDWPEDQNGEVQRNKRQQRVSVSRTEVPFEINMHCISTSQPLY